MAVLKASPTPVPLPTEAVEPSQVEQAHIDQALSASETAISAIDTILNVSMWSLGILAILLGIIAIFGWGVIRNACLDRAKQIANKRIKAYIEGEEFAALLKERIDKAAKAEWQARTIERITEAVRREGEDSPFPEKEKEG